MEDRAALACAADSGGTVSSPPDAEMRSRSPTCGRVKDLPKRAANLSCVHGALSCPDSATTRGPTHQRRPSRSRRNYTRMAEGGLKYNRFHVTALCSPTRAPLLTGRNSHTVGFGSVGEFAGGFPGYSATLPRDCAPLPRILRDNGYSTAAFGKWHLTPDGQQGPAGPFDRWPNGWGFDYFYGFLGGGASQWDPCLAEKPEDHRDAGGVLRPGEPVLPSGRDGRQVDRVAACDPGAGRAQAVLPLLLHRLQPRPASRGEGLGRQVQGTLRPGLDRLREEIFARQQVR
jgi:Sulfatase